MTEFFKCNFCDFTTSDYKTYKYHNSEHYKNPCLNLTCIVCLRNKPLTEFRLLHKKCRRCVFIFRYRYGKTKNIYPRYLEEINANLHAVPQAT